MTPEPHEIDHEPPATAAEWLEAGEAEPVPYTLTPRAEAVLASWDRFRAIGEAERLPLGEPEPEAEAEPEWDSADSNAYQARVEAGLEPEAEAEVLAERAQKWIKEQRELDVYTELDLELGL